MPEDKQEVKKAEEVKHQLEKELSDTIEKEPDELSEMELSGVAGGTGCDFTDVN